MVLNKEKYLYLLPLKNLPFFKVGISSGDFSRINHLNQLYDLDLDKSLIVKSPNHKLITLTEREILSVFEYRISDFKNMDGGSEIRKIEIWNLVIELLNYKKNYADISIYSFSELNIKNEKATAIIKRSSVNECKVKRLEKAQKLNNANFLLSAEDFMDAFDLVFEKVVYIEKNIDFTGYTFYFNNKLTYEIKHLYEKLNIILRFQSSKSDALFSFGCRSMSINKGYGYILEITFTILSLNEVKSYAAECNFKHFQILEDIINAVHDRCSDFIKAQKNNG